MRIVAWRFMILSTPCLLSCGSDATQPPAVASVTVTLANAVQVVNQTTQAAATVRDDAGTVLAGRHVIWASSNQLVATVSASGLVTAATPGTTTITATSEGISGGAILTVIPPPVTSVIVNLTTQVLAQHKTTQATTILRDGSGNELTGRQVSWTSSSSDVATVSSVGLITALRPGTAMITASSEGASGSATLTVIPPPVASVTVTLAKHVLTEHQLTQASATLRDSSGNELTDRQVGWTTSSPAVATVSAAGVVTALSPGTATIIASIDGASGASTLTVTAAVVATITVSLTTASLVIGQTSVAAALLRDSLGNELTVRPVTWTSSTPAVATVTPLGMVTAMAPGTATIVASSEGVTGSASLTVLLTSASGQVQVAGGLSPAGTAVTLRTRETPPRSYAGIVGADGDFRFGFPVPGDSVDLTVDASTGVRIFRPVVQSISASEATQSLKPLLIPRQVSITAGAYAPATVAVSLDAAFTPVCADTTNANCNSFFPGYWKTIRSGPVLWAERAFPVAVAFNRNESTTSIDATDSIAVWARLNQMENDVGRPLFRPANFDDLPSPTSGFSPNAILLSVDQTLQGFGAWSNWAWGFDGNMVSAKVRFASVAALRSGLISHEMLHTLGFHHTCRWDTALGGYGCPTQPRVSLSDVSAFTLGYDIRRTIQSRAPTSGVLEALQGERILEIGLATARVFADEQAPDRSVARITLFGRSLFVAGAP